MMEVPKRPWMRWDGGFKDYTKSCVGCSFYRKIENQEFCVWGVAFKYLIRSQKMRKCGLKNKDCGGESSAEYFGEIIEGIKNG